MVDLANKIYKDNFYEAEPYKKNVIYTVGAKPSPYNIFIIFISY